MTIPHRKLVDKIRYKAEEIGIVVVENEESYTSKCDALSLESVEKHKKYRGRRKYRGLFKSGNGKAVNADVNGAMNILRKVIGDSFVREIACMSNVYLPCRVNPLLKKSINY